MKEFTCSREAPETSSTYHELAPLSLPISLSPRLIVSSFAKRVAQPFQTLVQTVTRGGAGALNVPGSLTETVEAKLVGDFGRIHGILKPRVSETSPRKEVSDLQANLVCWRKPKEEHL